MSRQKKTAHVAERSEHRLAGLKAINPNLDLGEGCNVIVIQDTIDQLRDRVNIYNDALAMVDSTQIDIQNLEKQLTQLSQKALLGSRVLRLILKFTSKPFISDYKYLTSTLHPYAPPDRHSLHPRRSFYLGCLPKRKRGYSRSSLY